MLFIPLEIQKNNQKLAFFKTKTKLWCINIKIMRRTELLLCPVNCSFQPRWMAVCAWILCSCYSIYLKPLTDLVFNVVVSLIFRTMNSRGIDWKYCVTLLLNFVKNKLSSQLLPTNYKVQRNVGDVSSRLIKHQVKEVKCLVCSISV